MNKNNITLVASEESGEKNEHPNKKIIFLSSITILVILVSWTIFNWEIPNKAHTTQNDSQTVVHIDTKPSNKIAATVNGEAILESDLLVGLPEDLFEEQLKHFKANKLKRLIEHVILGQFLRQHDIIVSDTKVDSGVAEFEQMVMTPGCPCCGGGYKSLEHFMKLQHYSMTELRQRVSNDIGMNLYAERLAKEMATPQALTEEVKKTKSSYGNKLCAWLSHLFGICQEL